MPGTIQVSVLNYMDLPSSSPSSPLSLKVSVGKKEYQTWDKKDDFSFPLANLRDNIFIMIQDADGNEITRTVIQTREVIEKGSWDDLFALEGGGKVHMKLQFVLSEEEHNRIRRIRESVVKKKHGDTSPTNRTTPRATTIGSPLQVERDILAESTRPPQNEDGTVDVANLSQPSDHQTYIAKKEEMTFHQQETSPNDTTRSTLETPLSEVSKSSETEMNRGNAPRNVDVVNLSQPSDPQIYIAKKEETAFHQQENYPNDTDRSTLKTSVLAVSKSSGIKRHIGNTTRNDDVANLSQPRSDPQTYIAKKEEMSFHQQETSSNDTDKSTLETSVLAVSKSSGTERNLGDARRSPFSSLKSLSKSRSQGTLISIGKRELEKTPSSVKKMINAFESSQPLVYVKQHLPIAKPPSKLQPQKFAVDAPPENLIPIQVTKEEEESSKESDTGQIETKVSESLPEVYVKQHLPIAKPTSKLQPQKFALDAPPENPIPIPIRATKEEESSSKESDAGQIETKVSESLPEVKKYHEVEMTGVSESMYEKEQFVLTDNQKEGEDAMNNTTSEILFQGISVDGLRPEAFIHCEHNNKIESFGDSWIFPDYSRHLCITTASKKVMNMTRESRIQQKAMKRKLGNSIVMKKDKQNPRSSDVESRERSVTQVKRAAIMVAFGALVFLTRERNP